jgi:phosphatidylserine decarboxylase precursor-related protein
MIWPYVLAGTIALLAVVWWYLHRDPERADLHFAGFVSPASGVIVAVIERPTAVQKAKIKKGQHGITAFFDDIPEARTLIVIMMKPQHIHTQRMPIAGRVVRRQYKHGLKLNAVFGDYLRATAENEHVAYTIQGASGVRCKVYAIAGLLARRVRPIATLGETLPQGARLCKITFGSQVVLVLPKTKILVRVGQTVVDGVTPMAQ